MSTRASSLFVRAAAGAGVVACAAAFVGVAHAGTPADAVTATVAAATQPAAATVTPVTATVATATQPAAATVKPPAAPDTKVTPPAAPDVNVTPELAATTVTSAASASVAQAKDAAAHTTAAVEPVAEPRETAKDVLSSTLRTPDSTVETVATVVSAVSSTSASAVMPIAAETSAALPPTHPGGEGGSSAAASPAAVASPSPAAAEAASSSAIDLRPAAPREVPLQQKRRAAQPWSAGPVPLTATQSPTVNATAPTKPAVDGSRVPAPHNPPGGTLVGASSAAGSAGGLLLFGLVGLLFLLVIPNAVRWLRPALALGLSPADVATRDRPG